MDSCVNKFSSVVYKIMRLQKCTSQNSSIFHSIFQYFVEFYRYKDYFCLLDIFCAVHKLYAEWKEQNQCEENLFFCRLWTNKTAKFNCGQWKQTLPMHLLVSDFITSTKFYQFIVWFFYHHFKDISILIERYQFLVCLHKSTKPNINEYFAWNCSQPPWSMLWNEREATVCIVWPNLVLCDFSGTVSCIFNGSDFYGLKSFRGKH